VLAEIDDDSRTSLSNIAKKCRSSEQMVSYTVKQLIKKKIILGFSTLFDYTRFDLNSYIVLFRLFYRQKEDLEKFLNYLKNTPELSRLEVFDGKWNVYAMFLAPNPSYFNKILQKIRRDNKDLIRSDIIITTVVTYTFTRTYLHENKKIQKKFMIVGGDREISDFNNNQILICRRLLNNPVERIKDISRKTGLSFLTITNGLKALHNRGLIRGFKPIIDFEKADIVCKKIFIKYQSNLVNEDRIISFCKEHQNVVHIVKIFGEWDLIVTVECLKKSDFDDFLMDLREKYEDMIYDFEIIKVLKIAELRFLPKNYFETNYKED